MAPAFTHFQIDDGGGTPIAFAKVIDGADADLVRGEENEIVDKKLQATGFEHRFRAPVDTAVHFPMLDFESHEVPVPRISGRELDEVETTK